MEHVHAHPRYDTVVKRLRHEQLDHCLDAATQEQSATVRMRMCEFKDITKSL